MDTVNSIVVTVEKAADVAESFTLTGKCVMCGDCCRLMCKASYMLNEKGVCKFLAEDNTCDIQAGRVEPKEDEVAYWKANCETFPKYIATQSYDELLAAMTRLGWPTIRCGYVLETLSRG
jgi:hypothetical protein